MPAQEQTINRVQAANIERNCQKSCTYSITLATAHGSVTLSPVPLVGGSAEHKQAIVEQINSFINTSTMPFLYAAESEFGPEAVVIGLCVIISQIIIVQHTWRWLAAKRQRQQLASKARLAGM